MVGLLVLVALGWGLASFRAYMRGQNLRQAAEQAAKKRDFAEAYKLLREGLAQQPQDAELHFLAARTARRGRDYPAAAKHLADSEQLGGDADAIKLERALLLAQYGETDPVEGFLQRAVDQNHPDAAYILEALTEGYLKTLRLGSALGAVQKLLKLEPEHIQGLLWYATVSEHLQNMEEATKSYHKVLEFDPEHGPTRLQLATILLGAGRSKEAVVHFERLLRKASKQVNEVEVILGLAQCRRLQGDAEQAGELLERLPLGSLNPAPKAQALLEKARLAIAAGKPERAEPWLRTATELTPHDRESLFTLSQCLEQLGKKEEASAAREQWKRADKDAKDLVEVVRKVAEKPNDADLRCLAGEINLRLGREEEGERWLESALTKDPGHAQARRLLEDHQERKRKKAER